MPVTSWDVEGLRVTAFTKDVLSSSYGDEWWKTLVGSEPEDTSRRPAFGTHSVSGPVDDAVLSLNISPGRIDWLLMPASTDLLSETLLGDVAARLVRMDQRIADWLLQPKTTVGRLALGLAVRLPITNRIAGYEKLEKLLPSVKLDATNSSDFGYQINRPRMSKVANQLLVNRLSKWAVVELNVGLLGAQAAAVKTHFVRTELDVSTDKDSERDLTTAQGLKPLFREFADLAEEILAKGDIA